VEELLSLKWMNNLPHYLTLTLRKEMDFLGSVKLALTTQDLNFSSER
jgi:hypothetical protein